MYIDIVLIRESRKRKMKNIVKIRNIGISAHIDSGKTTLSERMLYYAGRIHRVQEVHDSNGGATMDYMELERERGITITSAATQVTWNDKSVNLIDTPGHVDFTVEVERSLRVLDGAIMVLCSVGGVQSQSFTVDQQMKRYRVPRIAFVNKMDRVGADPQRVRKDMAEKLGLNVVPIQLNMGEGEAFNGVIDLITMEAITFDGTGGEKVVRSPIPADYADAAVISREEMLEAISMFDDEMMEIVVDMGSIRIGVRTLYYMYGFNHDGTDLEGNWPILLDSGHHYKIIVDLNRDGINEIIARSLGACIIGGIFYENIFIINGKGEILGKRRIHNISTTLWRNGQNVSVVLDNTVQPDKIVADGKITLARKGDNIQAGLQFPIVDSSSDSRVYIELMPIEVDLQTGSSVGKRKRVIEVTVLLYDTSHVEVRKNKVPIRQIGIDHLDSPVPKKSENLTISGLLGWDDEITISIGQTIPLPMQLLGVAYKVRV